MHSLKGHRVNRKLFCSLQSILNAINHRRLGKEENWARIWMLGEMTRYIDNIQRVQSFTRAILVGKTNETLRRRSRRLKRAEAITCAECSSASPPLVKCKDLHNFQQKHLLYSMSFISYIAIVLVNKLNRTCRKCRAVKASHMYTFSTTTSGAE